MTPRLVAGLAVAALVALGGAAWQWQANSVSYIEAERGERLLPGLLGKANDVAAIAIIQGPRSIRIERTADGKYVLAESGYPVQGGKFQSAIVAAASLEKFEAKTVRPEKYPLIEVEDPGTVAARSQLMRFESADGSILAEIITGKKARGRVGGALGDGQYVRIPGEERSWLARGVIESGFDLGGWVDTVVVSLKTDEVVRATFQAGEDPVLTVRRTGLTEGGQPKFEVDNLPDGRKPKNELTVRYAATDLANASFVDVRKDAGGVVAQRTTLTMSNGLTVAFLLTADDWLSVKVLAEGKGDAATEKDILTQTEGYQFKLADYKLKQFKLTMADLTDPAN
jgi:hypothetical protein